MSGTRWPGERLDALLTGLEEDVLRPVATGAEVTDGAGAKWDVQALRTRIEVLIEARAGEVRRGHKSEYGEGTMPQGASAKVAAAMARLARWGRGQGAAQAAAQVRMAFSGERSEKGGGIERRGLPDERGGKAGGEGKDS